MRILAIHAAFDRTERNMLRAFADAGHYVEAVCQPEYVEVPERLGIRTTALKFRSRLAPSAIRVLRAKMMDGSFDIAHSFINRALSNALIASRGLNVKHVAYRGFVGHVRRWNPASWLTYLNPRISRIVCVSDAVRRYLLGQGVASGRLTTIHKGHDPAWYTPAPRPALSAFGIPENAFVVGFVGNMRPSKGAHVLVDAVSRLAGDPRMHLLLVGEVRYAGVRDAASRSAMRDRIHIPGFREDAAALMGACDVVALPTLESEGLARSVVEAMAQGVPCVVSSVGGMPELVVDGDCGRLVPPGDTSAMADAIAGYANNEATRRAHGGRARDRIAGPFNVSQTIARTLRVYEEVLGASAPAPHAL